MRTVFVLFDFLNRHTLGAYGGTRTPTPNFDRLAARARVYDGHYVGSLPCMPARRDLLTGRLTFLHRSWGPLEPFDNAFPELLKTKGVHSHLVTDHYHYWEDGGATYFLLGEHDFWAKNRMTMYEEIVHIPLFAHDPRAPEPGRVRRLTQSIDLCPTILDLYDVSPPAECEGRSVLRPHEREAMIFGYFGGAVNVTDGRFTYHRFPDGIEKQDIYQYTVMPTHLMHRFTPEELSGATLAAPFGWTKNVPLLRVPVISRSPMYVNYGPGSLLERDARLQDLAADPGQDRPLDDPVEETRLVALMRELMRANEAPPEAFARLRI